MRITPPPIDNSPKQSNFDSPPPVSHRDQKRMVLILVGAAIAVLLLFLFMISLLGGSMSADGDGKPSEGSASMEVADSMGTSTEPTKDNKNESNSPSSVDPPSEIQDDESPEEVESGNSNLELTEEEKRQFSANVNSSGGGGLSPVGKDNVGFFGIRATGNHIGFVIDKSGSMEGGRIQLAKQELIKSLQALEPDQQFSLYFYNDRAQYLSDHVKSKATQSNIDAAKHWIHQIHAIGGTAPDGAISLALNADCDLIYILSDGEFNTTGTDVANMNSKGIPIHTVALESDSYSLKRIAKQNNGRYRSVR